VLTGFLKCAFLQVREDCGTEVMQRSVAKKFVVAGYTSVISIVLADKTLDFEIEEVCARIRALFYSVLVGYVEHCCAYLITVVLIPRFAILNSIIQ
jgi:hypothetical protein